MRNQYIHRLSLTAAGILLICLGLFIVLGRLQATGPIVVVFFALLAFGFRGFPLVKGISYTMIIFSAVSLALYFPSYFINARGFRFTSLITPLIQVIMFGMGTEMGIKDFAGVIKAPRSVGIGILGHFTFMPLIGFSLARLFQFPPEIAAGVVLIGSMPCGLASNVMSYLAKANLALSITLTAVSTLLSPFLTPMLMKLLGGQFITVNVLNMMWDIVKIVIIPIGGGLLFNRLLKGKIGWLDKAMPLLSMAGITFIITIITAAGRDNLLVIGPALILCAMLHNSSGYLFGYWVGRLFRLKEQDCRTIAIEVGMQNGGLATSLAKEMGKAATIGLAPAVFGPLMNITGSVLASYWHRKPSLENL